MFIIDAIIDLILAPFEKTHIILPAIYISFILSLLIFIIFKMLFDKKKAKEILQKIEVILYEAYLYRFKTKYFLKCLKRLISVLFTMISMALIPIILSSMVFVLIYIGVERRLNYRSFKERENIIICIDNSSNDLIGIEKDDIIIKDSIRDLNEIYYRIKANTSGEHYIKVKRKNREDELIKIVVNRNVIVKKYQQGVTVFYPENDSLFFEIALISFTIISILFFILLI
ncbi:MAG: hypothetical protein AB1765_10755 [Candidatus Hydrogenedentota bacterium]